MTIRVDDDATVTYPVTDDATPPGTLNFTPVVNAWHSDGTTTTIPDADWTSDPGPTRDLEVPLNSLTAGIWGLGLTINGDTDLFLGNVFIQ